MKIIKLSCRTREVGGTRGARRARLAGRLPSVLYGRAIDPVHVDIDIKEFRVALDGGARVVDLEREEDGAVVRAVLKDVQFDALGRKLVHVDFQRVDPKRELLLQMPMTLVGVPAGVLKGGILTAVSKTLPILCLPGDIPDELRVDISGLGLGESLHAGDVPLPEKVRLGCEPEETMIAVTVPRGVDEDKPAEEGAEGEEGAEATAGDDE